MRQCEAFAHRFTCCVFGCVYNSRIIARLGRYLSAYVLDALIHGIHLYIFRSTMKSMYLLIIYSSIRERYLPCFKFEWRTYTHISS